MVQEATRTESITRLDAFYADELGCEEELLYQQGLHLLVSRKRTRPGWAGYTKPLLAVARGESCVLSTRPDMESSVRSELARVGDGVDATWTLFERLRRVSQRAVPYAFILCGYSMYCDATIFRPLAGRAVRLPRDDPRGRDLRHRFDGELFVTFGSGGELASWAAIKLKSQSVWEIAVVTEPAHRGRGLAKHVVSAATAYILEQGRAALYIHDRSNVASGKVCRALGYQEYAQEFFSEY